MTDSTSRDNLAQRTKDFFLVKDKTFKEAARSGKTLEEAARLANEAHQKIHPGRGGARPGAGRKAGSGKGRKDTAYIGFNVSEQFKSDFEAAARKNGLTQIDFFKTLFKSYLSRE